MRAPSARTVLRAPPSKCPGFLARGCWWRSTPWRWSRRVIPPEHSMRIIDEAALRAAITSRLAVDAMREAFRADGDGRAHVPAVINLDIPAHRGEFHVKSAYIEGVPHVAVKIASGFFDNP